MNEHGVGGRKHEQEFERSRIMFDSLLILAQRECPFRVIERVADSRGWIRGCGGSC